VLATDDVALELGVSAERVRALIAARRLPAVKRGRTWLVRRVDLALVSHRPPGRPRRRTDRQEEESVAAAYAAEGPAILVSHDGVGSVGMQVLAVGSQKGGVGKTTSTLYLAAHAAAWYAARGLAGAVAIIDRDETQNLRTQVARRPGLLAPGVDLLDGTDLPAADAGYRLVLIDTPPGNTAIGSLHQAHLVLVPVHPSEAGLANLQTYLRHIEAQRLVLAPRLRLLALLPTMVERTVLQRDMLKVIEHIAGDHEPPLRMLSSVPRRAAIADFNYRSPEYRKVAEEVFGGRIDQVAG